MYIIIGIIILCVICFICIKNIKTLKRKISEDVHLILHPQSKPITHENANLELKSTHEHAKETGKNKKVLNVGGNNKTIPLPSQYVEFEHLLLDIDPRGSPDIVCDARMLTTLDPCQFDAVYCSHNLEHYYRHDVQKVLTGFLHVLKDDGFVHIRVPDIQEVMRIATEQNLDIDDTLYKTQAGAPIMILDVLYGWGLEIEESGQDFYAHKTGFTKKSLINALEEAGFSKIYTGASNFEIQAVAFKGSPNQTTIELFNISPD